MRYGVTSRAIGPHALADLAQEAEAAGWDGIFVWDGAFGEDPWISLAAVAMRTERICFGTMLTPPSRRRPWKLASEAATLDILSHGRVILSFGLGAAEFLHHIGDETDRKTRAELLDETLDILDGLWSGERFDYTGKHYRMEDAIFSPLPIQTPRVPIWVVGAWPRMKSMRRVLRCDGLLPAKMSPSGAFSEATPNDIGEMKTFVDEHRTLTTPFDIIMEGSTPGDDPEKAASTVRPLADAGVTWWLENIWNEPWQYGEIEGMRQRIRQGPPKP